VFVTASDRLHGKAAYEMIVETARTLNLAGASVFLVDFSFGAHQRIRDAKSDYLCFDIPVMVEIVDEVENVGKLRTALDSMVVEGLVVSRPIRVIRYAGRSIPEQESAGALAKNATDPTHDSRGPNPMRIEGDAQRLSVYIGSSDTWRGRNLVTAIVEKCRELGIAGATATTGTMGFGKASRIHRAHLLGLSEDLPVRIEIVDRPEQIKMILPALDDLVQGGLIILEDVHVIRYLHDPKRA
jgi:PII-like signaling protein